jgi:hypothetical protein
MQAWPVATPDKCRAKNNRRYIMYKTNDEIKPEERAALLSKASKYETALKKAEELKKLDKLTYRHPIHVISEQEEAYINARVDFVETLIKTYHPQATTEEFKILFFKLTVKINTVISTMRKEFGACDAKAKKVRDFLNPNWPMG